MLLSANPKAGGLPARLQSQAPCQARHDAESRRKHGFFVGFSEIACRVFAICDEICEAKAVERVERRPEAIRAVCGYRNKTGLTPAFEAERRQSPRRSAGDPDCFTGKDMDWVLDLFWIFCAAVVTANIAVRLRYPGAAPARPIRDALIPVAADPPPEVVPDLLMEAADD